MRENIRVDGFQPQPRPELEMKTCVEVMSNVLESENMARDMPIPLHERDHPLLLLKISVLEISVEASRRYKIRFNKK